MHLSELHKFVADPSREFALSFVAKGGEVVTVSRCVCTSFHSSGRTLNIMLLPSRQVRKVIRHTILTVNNQRFYL